MNTSDSQEPTRCQAGAHCRLGADNGSCLAGAAGTGIFRTGANGRPYGVVEKLAAACVALFAAGHAPDTPPPPSSDAGAPEAP